MKGLLFTYLLTYGGAFASLFNPFVGLLVYICFAIVKPEAMWHWSVPQGNYSRIIALALLVGWALNGFGNWNIGRARAILVCLVGFFAWAGLSAAFAPHHDVAFAFLEQKGKIVLPVVVGATLIDSVSKLKALAWTLVLSQGYVAYDLNMSYFSGFNKLEQVGFSGFDNNSLTIALVTGVGLAFFLGLRERILWRKLLAFGCAALMTHAVLFSFSRGGMVALLATGLVSFVLIPKQPKHYLLFALGVVLALRMAGPEVRERFFTSFAAEEERDSSAQSRLILWPVAQRMMHESPMVGVGPDHFPLRAAEYGLPSNIEAHSLWLQTGAEIGIPGLLFLLAFYLIAARRLWGLARARSRLSAEAAFHGDVACMVIAALAGFLPAAQFVSLEGLELPYYIVLLGAGTLKVYYSPAVQSAPYPGPIPAYDWQPQWQQQYGDPR